jgi:hypothetical protein
MQTFVPYADFAASAAVLDDKRLGKQRVETLQILRALVFPSYRGWKNHPATRMWRGFTAALVAYGTAVCDEWERRGRVDAVRAALVAFSGGVRPDVAALRAAGALPPWLGLEPLHVSHRSALVRKEPEHYRTYFPDVPDDLPYVWPPAAFPRWPVRRGAGPLTFDAALAELGWTRPRRGQREAVEALVRGDDVTLRWQPGAGASSVGLLAALCRAGSTLWLSPHAGPTDLSAPPLAQLRPTVDGPVRSKAATSIARPPTADDLAALAAEAQAPPEFAFHRPAALADPDVTASLDRLDVSLVVCDGTPEPVRWRAAPVLHLPLSPRAGEG